MAQHGDERVRAKVREGGAEAPKNEGWLNTKGNPPKARLRATRGSDMGHWDVLDMMGIVPEAYELVEKGLLSEEDFSHFAFTHPAELFRV